MVKTKVLVFLVALSATGQADAQQPSLRDLNDALMRGQQERESAEQQARERIAAMRGRLRALLPQYVSQAVAALAREGVSFGNTGEAIHGMIRDRDYTVIDKVGQVVVLGDSASNTTVTLLSLAAVPWFAITFEGIFPDSLAAWGPSQPCAYRIRVTDQFSGTPDTAATRVDCAAFEGGAAQVAFDSMLRAKVREVLERVSRMPSRR